MQNYIFFQVTSNFDGKVVYQGWIQTTTDKKVNPLQLAQRLRESLCFVEAYKTNDPTVPYTAHAHITTDKVHGFCIPDSPTLTLSCR